MRVIAGDLKGRNLVAPIGRTVRPTSDRVREAIFSALGDVAGARILDLYCGTGALAIEALSRGAANATLVDRDTRPALGNIEHLGLRDRTDLIRADALKWLADPPAAGFDLVFIDPPYKLADRIESELEIHIAELLSEGGRLIVEGPAQRPIVLEGMEVLRNRRYGRTHVTFYRRGDNEMRIDS